MTHVALTIAGSDPSGGAGIQADLKTFHQRGVYGTSVVTLVTVQNTRRLETVQPLPANLVQAQLDAVLEDIPPGAAKTGALGNAAIIRAIAERAKKFRFPLVVDPVMNSMHGIPLIAEEARVDLAEVLLPFAFLVTPNLEEASVLSGIEVKDVSSMEEAARRIARHGVQAVLVKGGHLPNVNAVDVLFWKGKIQRFKARRIHTSQPHGTGCTFSAAITAELAKGCELPEAVSTAKKFISLAIESRPSLGKGSGPVNHHARLR